MAGKHARLSPSAASIWMNCPGSISITKDLVDKTNKYASEGTAAHQLAEECLARNESPFDRMGEHFEADKQVFMVDTDMATHVQVYVDAVRAKAEEAGQPIQVEQKVSLEYLTKTKDLGGTVDALFADIVFENTLYVYDLKFGKGIVVDVINNPQLMIYAVGALGKYMNADGRSSIEYVEMGIVQPRAFHSDGPVRTYTMLVEDLLEWADNTLLPAVDATYSDNPVFQSGSHCRWCKAKRDQVCPILNQDVYAIAQQSFPEVVESSLPDPKEMDVETLAKVLEGGKIIKSWYEGVCKYAHDRALAGDKIPGKKLIKGFGDRKWLDPGLVERTMGGKYPLIMTVPSKPQLKSVAQVEATLKKEYDLKKKNVDELLARLWEKPEKGLKLVSEDHKAPGVDPLKSSTEEAEGAFDVALDETEDFLN